VTLIVSLFACVARFCQRKEKNDQSQNKLDAIFRLNKRATNQLVQETVYTQPFILIVQCDYVPFCFRQFLCLIIQWHHKCMRTLTQRLKRNQKYLPL